MRLENRIAVVTGAGRGIGLATARVLAAEGAQVAAAEIDADLARSAAAAIGERAWPIQVDVSRAEEVKRLFGEVGERFGRLDVLVCNAGRLFQKNTLSATEEDWDACLAVNLKATWYCAREARPLLAASGRGGIVAVASAQAYRSSANSFPYSAAKGGLLALVRSLAVEYAPAVRVNAVIPGQVESVRTEPFFQSFRDPEEARRRVLASYPMRRLGKPEDVARAILFLASDDAAWMTGSYLTVDGGREAAMLDLSDLQK